MMIRRLISSFSPTHWVLVFAAAAAASLAMAYTAQYGFGLEPCELCLFQRVPFAAVIALGVLNLTVRKPRAVLWAMGACFAVGAAIASFHTGVERHWWPGLEACSAILDASDLEKLRAQIMNGPRARCDEIPWSLFGLSMANYNVAFSGGLAGLSVWAARRK